MISELNELVTGLREVKILIRNWLKITNTRKIYWFAHDISNWNHFPNASKIKRALPTKFAYIWIRNRLTIILSRRSHYFISLLSVPRKFCQFSFIYMFTTIIFAIKWTSWALPRCIFLDGIYPGTSAFTTLLCGIWENMISPVNNDIARETVDLLRRLGYMRNEHLMNIRPYASIKTQIYD